jgi:putative FmdB family regulatory protein
MAIGSQAGKIARAETSRLINERCILDRRWWNALREIGFCLEANVDRRCSMPVYEFNCHDCHKTFEVTRPMSESTAGASCPACGSHNVERTWSSVIAKTSKKS